MSNILGSKVLIVPTDRIHDNLFIKPNELDVNLLGEIDPDCPHDSDGIAPCRRFQPLVMFVGGAGDPETGALLNGVFRRYDGSHEDIQDIGYGAWQTGPQVKALALHWMTQGQKVVLVGHSYGGDTVMDISRELSGVGKEIELVVTLDPVSRGGPRADQPKPSGVKKWLNVYVDYERAGRGRDNLIALAGGVWGNCPNADANHPYVDGSGIEHGKAIEMFPYVRSDVEAVI